MKHSFPATQWSLILNLQKAPGSSGDSAEMAAFFQLYTDPLIRFIQLLGVSLEDAKDLTQEIFISIYTGNKFTELDPQKGRMRSYLKTAAKHKVLNYFRDKQRSKRGSGAPHVPLEDLDLADKTGNPEKNFDKKWALTLLELATQELKDDYYSRDRSQWFELLFPRLTKTHGAPMYADLAQQLNSSESAVKSALHRMKQKFQVCLQDQVARTVSSESEVEKELVYLFDALA